MVTFKNLGLLQYVAVVGTTLGSIASADTLLLEFTSASCAPCQEMHQTIAQLATAGYQVRQIDIAREPALREQFKVDQVPTVISLVNGREYARMVGKGPLEKLRQILPPVQRGQSPDSWASQPVTQLASTAGNMSVPNYSSLETPQAGRIIELEDPNRPAPRPTPPASNPFGSVPAPTAPSTANHSRLLEATVKIAVEDPEGTSSGTGTIVDAREGAALILTCGHIFRESAGKGAIAITFFQATPAGAQPHETVAGQVLNYDLERDLALIVVRPQQPVSAAPIAPVNTPLMPGASVTTVGCNGGANPTVIDSHITTIDRYQGPPNIEVAGAPVEGRSGGGLFNSGGQLIGVCFAADPQANEGLYASLPSIQAKLDSLNLAMVYQSPSATLASTASATTPSVAPPAASLAAENPVSMPTAMSAPNAAAAPSQASSVAIRGQDELVDRLPDELSRAAGIGGPSPLSASEQAALEELQRRGLKSEVICIIRPQDPSGKSEVITLNHVSPEFVRRLAEPGESRSPATAAAGQLLR